MPLVRVVEIEAPDFDWSAVDLVTDRNGLRKLLRWIRDPQAREFRIDTQLAGEKTVLFSRWEKRSAESLDDRVKPNGRTYQTYGFSFEKASTKPAAGCAGSTGYHRIVEYVGVQSSYKPPVCLTSVVGLFWPQGRRAIRGGRLHPAATSKESRKAQSQGRRGQPGRCFRRHIALCSRGYSREGRVRPSCPARRIPRSPEQSRRTQHHIRVVEGQQIRLDGVVPTAVPLADAAPFPRHARERAVQQRGEAEAGDCGLCRGLAGFAGRPVGAAEGAGCYQACGAEARKGWKAEPRMPERRVECV